MYYIFCTIDIYITHDTLTSTYYMLCILCETRKRERERYICTYYIYIYIHIHIYRHAHEKTFLWFLFPEPSPSLSRLCAPQAKEEKAKNFPEQLEQILKSRPLLLGFRVQSSGFRV